MARLAGGGGHGLAELLLHQVAVSSLPVGAGGGAVSGQGAGGVDRAGVGEQVAGGVGRGRRKEQEKHDLEITETSWG